MGVNVAEEGPKRDQKGSEEPQLERAWEDLTLVKFTASEEGRCALLFCSVPRSPWENIGMDLAEQAL